MTNREVGLVWMAYILGRLYDAWPMKIVIDLPDAQAATGVQAETEFATKRLWFDLGRWMISEGIVRAGRGAVNSVALDDVVLTAKGFELLGKALPGAEKSLGTRLEDFAKATSREVAKEGAKKATTELTQMASDLIGSFLGNFVKGLTS